MKSIITAILILTAASSWSYEQTNENLNSALKTAAVIIQDGTLPIGTQDSKKQTEIKDNILLGFNFGIGISNGLTMVLTDSANKPKFSFHGGFDSIFYFTRNLGLMFDINLYYFHLKEESDGGNFVEYSLFYLGFILAPVLRLGGFNFYAGISYGIILSGKYESHSETDDTTDMYTQPDICYVFGAGYMFSFSNKISMFVNIQIRGQLNNFVAFNDPVKTGNKAFAFYLNLGLLFGVK